MKANWLPTPEQQAEIDAHWANVRTGLHTSELHSYRDDARKLVVMHRAIARTCIEGAAFHMRQAAAQSEATQ